jgi:universal stress protein E
MPDQPRFMLVVSHQMENTPAFDRAAALAKASGAALHIVAFDYLEGLASAGVVNDEAREQMRIDYVERHRQWLEAQARPLRKSAYPSPPKWSGWKDPCRKSSFISKSSRWPC